MSKKDNDRATGTAHHAQREPIQPMSNGLVDRYPWVVVVFAALVAGVLLYYVIWM